MVVANEAVVLIAIAVVVVDTVVVTVKVIAVVTVVLMVKLLKMVKIVKVVKVARRIAVVIIRHANQSSERAVVLNAFSNNIVILSETACPHLAGRIPLYGICIF
jgi:hypothetical protein